MWITRVSINNPVFATMVMVALCVLGLFSLNRLGVEQMPDITLPRRLGGGAVPRRQPRGGGARDHQAAGRGGEQRGRRQAHHLAQRWKAAARPASSSAWTPTWAARCRRCATASPPCRPVFPKDAKAPLIARWNNDNAQPVVNAGAAVKTPQRARAVDPGRPGGRQAPAARGRRGPRRDQRPDGARGAHRPRPAAPARLRRDAGGDRHRAEARPTPTSRWAC